MKEISEENKVHELFNRADELFVKGKETLDEFWRMM